MNNDLILIIVGTLIGFISAAAIELIKTYLAQKRISQEQYDIEIQSQIKNIKDSLYDNNEDENWPAWLKLVVTQPTSFKERIFRSRVDALITNSGDRARLKKMLKDIGYYTRHPKKEETLKDRLVAITKRALMAIGFIINSKDDETFKEDLETIGIGGKIAKDIYANRNEYNKTIQKYFLVRSQLIGRGSICEIILHDLSLSRVHSLLKFETGNYIIYDMGSTAGTVVNGERVTKRGRILKHGDIIIVGLSVLIFEGINPNFEIQREAITKSKD